MFVGLACSLLPLGVLFGVLAGLGFKTVSWNGEPVHGLAGLLLGTALGVVMTLTFTVFLGTAMVVGLWLYSKVRPTSLWVKNVEVTSETVA